MDELDVEARLQRLRIAQPSADLRRRLLAAEQEPPVVSWSWLPELALAAAIVLCSLGVLAVSGWRPGSGGEPFSEFASPVTSPMPDIEEARRQGAGSARQVSEALELGRPLTRYLEARMATHRVAMGREVTRRLTDPTYGSKEHSP